MKEKENRIKKTGKISVRDELSVTCQKCHEQIKGWNQKQVLWNLDTHNRAKHSEVKDE